MTPGEQVTLREFRQEVKDEFAAIRNEFRFAQTQQAADFAPALDFYNRVNTVTQGLSRVGRFVKWGAGLGASVVVIVGGLHSLGVF